jgi:hypothetical protein
VRSLFAVLRELVVPAGSPATSPSIILSGDVPSELTTYYATELASVVGYQAWRFSNTKYHYAANVFNVANSFFCFGWVNAGVVREVYRSSITAAGTAALLFSNREPTSKIIVGPDTVTAANHDSRALNTAGTTTSGTFVAMPGTPTFQVDKQYDSGETELLVRWHHGLSSTATATEGRLGVRINGGTTTEIIRWTFDVANVALPLSGERKITGIAAGIITLELMWSRTSGGGTLTSVASSAFSVVAQEVAA